MIICSISGSKRTRFFFLPTHLLKGMHAIPLNVLMTALQAVLFNKQLYMRHFFFFEKHDTIFLNCATL